MVKTSCSARGPGLNSQHPHGDSLTILNSSLMGSSILFWPPWAAGTHAIIEIHPEMHIHIKHIV